MANITITNIGEEPRQLRPFRNAEKVTVQPGESILCDHDWVKANALSAYGDFYRVEDGGIQPGLKEVLKFLEKATDEEKVEIAKVVGDPVTTTFADVQAFLNGEATQEQLEEIAAFTLPFTVKPDGEETTPPEETVTEGEGEKEETTSPGPEVTEATEATEETVIQNTTEAKDAKTSTKAKK